MAIDPIQCMGNPWEQEWLAENGGDPLAYPTELENQVPIIRGYYEGEGIEILDIKAAVTHDVICYSCSCTDGYTVWMKVPGIYEDDLASMGFRKENPPGGV